MATNGTATDGSAQVSEISIDLLTKRVDQPQPSEATGSRRQSQPSEATGSRRQPQPSEATGSRRQSQPSEATCSRRHGRPAEASVSIPHERAQTVRATVTNTDGGRWRCDVQVDPSSAAATRPLEEEQAVPVGELVDWVTPVLNIIEALVTEASC
jgi:hypothetical protein